MTSKQHNQSAINAKLVELASAVKVVHASKSDSDHLGTIFGKVWEDHPLYCHMIENPEKRHRMARWVNQRVVAYGQYYGTVYTDENKTGASVFMEAGGKGITIPKLIRLGLLQAPFKMGWGGFRKFLRFTSVTEEIHKRHMPGLHCFEIATAVDADLHGNGIGSALTTAALVTAGTDVADKNNLPCYTETVFENAAEWYEHLGYETIEEVSIPEVGKMWAMVRQPKASS